MLAGTASGLVGVRAAMNDRHASMPAPNGGELAGLWDSLRGKPLLAQLAVWVALWPAMAALWLARSPRLAGRQACLRRRPARRRLMWLKILASGHAAAVLHADLDDHSPFLAFEYVAGFALGQHACAAGPLPVGQLRLLALGLAEAPRAIHDAGAVHRNLSSGKVLLADGGPRVVDFGIARAVESRRHRHGDRPDGGPAWRPHATEGVRADSHVTQRLVTCSVAQKSSELCAIQLRA